VTLGDGMIFNDMKRRAASLRQMSHLSSLVEWKDLRFTQKKFDEQSCAHVGSEAVRSIDSIIS